FSFHSLSLRHSYVCWCSLLSTSAIMSTNSKHASYKEKAISEWELDDLVGWINEKRKNLLNDDEIEKLRKAGVIGHSFLSSETHSKAFFIDDCGISPGKAVSLAKLARDLAEEDSKLLSFMSCTYHVDSKLTTSQETDSRPKMWRCPTPPI